MAEAGGLRVQGQLGLHSKLRLQHLPSMCKTLGLILGTEKDQDRPVSKIRKPERKTN